MSVAGSYNISIKTPMGDQTALFTVNVDGDSFSGSSVGAMGTMEIPTGTVDGNKLTWKMDMKVPMPMTLDCDATVDGDAISGNVRAGAFGSMAMTGTRA